MALSLGQLVTGGAAFSRGQREAEQAERTARLNQLQIEEANRQDYLRRIAPKMAPIGEPPGGLRLQPALETVLPPMDGTLAPSRPRPTPPPAQAAPTGFVDT